MDGYVLTSFPVVWPTFLVNSPYDPLFNVYRWRGHLEYRVDDQSEQQWSFKWARTSVGIEHTGGRNEWLSMDNLQVRSLSVSFASALLTSVPRVTPDVAHVPTNLERKINVAGSACE
jgi:hypothetical protein